MLPGVGVPNNVRNALTRLIKLTQTFEKMGFATDAYLGYLTVSPAHLGTGMHFQGSITMGVGNKSEDEIDTINQMVQERLIQGRGMMADVQQVRDDTQALSLRLSFKTAQTLAPNYNESIQIDDYLYGIQTLGEFLESASMSPPPGHAADLRSESMPPQSSQQEVPGGVGTYSDDGGAQQ